VAEELGLGRDGSEGKDSVLVFSPDDRSATVHSFLDIAYLELQADGLHSS
jgi:hypothetical protein